MVMNLELRKSYLGGTDLVAISGLSKYESPGDVWLEKVKGKLSSTSPAAQAGKDREPVVAMRHKRAAEERGEIVRLAELSDPVYDAEFPFIAANPDRIYTNRKRILECKTADEMQLYESGTEWGMDGQRNGVPVYYFGQVNHYIGLMKFDDGVLSAFFLGRSREQRDYPIDFDQDLYRLMRENGVNFWRTYVAPRVQPPLELFSPGRIMEALADSALAKVGKTGIVVEADQTLQEMARRYKAISDRLLAEDEAKKRLAGQIASWITAQGATKVQHELGTFTYQKPEPKPEKQVFDAEKAWDSLMDSFRPGMPSITSDELLLLAEEIHTRCTITVDSEPQTPRLHPYWK